MKSPKVATKLIGYWAPSERYSELMVLVFSGAKAPRRETSD
jgi:hypothetical protein